MTSDRRTASAKSGIRFSLEIMVAQELKIKVPQGQELLNHDT